MELNTIQQHLEYDGPLISCMKLTTRKEWVKCKPGDIVTVSPHMVKYRVKKIIKKGQHLCTIKVRRL